MTDAASSTLHRQKRFFRLLVVVCIASLMLVCLSVAWRQLSQHRIGQQSLRVATEMATNAVKVIEQRLDGLSVADEIAREITERQLSDAEIDELLHERLDENADIGALSAGFVDTANPQHPRTISWIRGPDGMQHTSGRLQEDADDEQAKWYWEPFRRGQGFWSQTPFLSPYTHVWWSGGYSAPFLRLDENGQPQPAGVISADIPLKMLRREVYELVKAEMAVLPPEASYGFVVAKSGRIISHPDQRVVEQGRSIDECVPVIDGIESIEQLPLLAPDQNVRFLADQTSREFGHERCFLFAPVTSAGWWVILALDEHEIYQSAENIRSLRHLDISVLLSVLLFCYAGVNLLCRVDRGGQTSAWISSSAFAILCTGGIIAMWWLHVIREVPREDKDILLIDDAIAAKVRLQYGSQAGDEPHVVPTGIFIQSAEFSGANNVTVTGYVWQKYSKEMHLERRPDIESPGFIFPESEETTTELAYQRTEGDMTVRGWYFKAVLRQEFDYRHYPFDSEDVWVRIWHRDIGRGVLLSPDLDSYSTIVPTHLPGIEQEDFVLEGWNVNRSFFSYRRNSYNVNFGIDAYAGQTNFPELYFHIGMERVFIHPFITNVLPLTVVALLLFAILLTARLQGEQGTLRGFNTTNVLSFCAALFFVVIVSHIGLREHLAARGLIYLEYFYFVGYLSIVAVAINALLLTSSLRLPLLHYHDNLLARILYWPTYCGTLLALTIWSFA